jgi:hypothetical protein
MDKKFGGGFGQCCKKLETKNQLCLTLIDFIDVWFRTRALELWLAGMVLRHLRNSEPDILRTALHLNLNEARLTAFSNNGIRCAPDEFETACA